MKKLYWVSVELDWRVDLLVAIVAVVGLLSVTHFKLFVPAPHYEEKLAAATLMKKGMDVIDRYREMHHIDDKYADDGNVNVAGGTDDTQSKMKSGLIGIPFSPITSID
uniref:Uncharacterized protein n=1 Tax=Candidatus Kentrum eta TaxID=2126337 RepID=A0A450UB11_9GAMM|nr:MAG: hypothetical protein BECKH772A_GA0070896_1000431 [Candidatus Kentron sp. H]VFJ89394.1 MAG: hypothetical protein BECKH772B_GA0070898_1000431 [Candidatus Kentron sp. H]VFJ95997.1 MAG: hypothetical protein BECKH772C_GA0070978_1000432 [Candidatus Kentron sp. H]